MLLLDGELYPGGEEGRDREVFRVEDPGREVGSHSRCPERSGKRGRSSDSKEVGRASRGCERTFILKINKVKISMSLSYQREIQSFMC